MRPCASKRIGRSLLVAATTLLSAPAFSQEAAPPVGYPVVGPYISAGGGFNIKGNESIKNLSGPLATSGFTTGASTPNLNFGTSLGGAAAGAFGWGLGNGIRLEAQFDYAGNAIDSFSGVNRLGFGASAGRTGGSEKIWGGMFNVLYDFVGFVPAVVPYAGIGIGYQRAHLSNFTAVGTGTAAALTPTLGSNDTRASFAVQGILGVAYPIEQVPGLALFADYHIMGMTGTRTYNASVTTTSPAGVQRTAVGTMQVGHEYDNIFIFGVRYNFGVTPPAPPQAPVPGPRPLAPTWSSSAGIRRRSPIAPGGSSRRRRTTRRTCSTLGSRSMATLTPPVSPSITRACRSAAPRRWRASWSGTGCRRVRSPSKDSAIRICSSQPGRACASRRTGAWRSS
jgi:hypothetical protein